MYTYRGRVSPDEFCVNAFQYLIEQFAKLNSDSFIYDSMIQQQSNNEEKGKTTEKKMERERDRQRERQIERETDRERDIYREREIERETDI